MSPVSRRSKADVRDAGSRHPVTPSQARAGWTRTGGDPHTQAVRRRGDPRWVTVPSDCAASVLAMTHDQILLLIASAAAGLIVLLINLRVA